MVSSSPFMMMEPVTLALSSSRPIRLNAVTDLPEPDSPTMARISPASTSKLTSSTALTMPFLTGNSVERFFTDNSMRSPLPCFGVETVAHAVAQEV